MQFGSMGISNIRIATTPVISSHQAEDTIIQAFSRDELEVNKIFQTELKVIPELPAGSDTYADYSGMEGEGITYHLVWVVSFQRAFPGRDYEAWADAISGEIVYYKSLIEEGHVSGNVTIIPGKQG